MVSAASDDVCDCVLSRSRIRAFVGIKEKLDDLRMVSPALLGVFQYFTVGLFSLNFLAGVW